MSIQKRKGLKPILNGVTLAAFTLQCIPQKVNSLANSLCAKQHFWKPLLTSLAYPYIHKYKWKLWPGCSSDPTVWCEVPPELQHARLQKHTCTLMWLWRDKLKSRWLDSWPHCLFCWSVLGQGCLPCTSVCEFSVWQKKHCLHQAERYPCRECSVNELIWL